MYKQLVKKGKLGARFQFIIVKVVKNKQYIGFAKIAIKKQKKDFTNMIILEIIMKEVVEKFQIKKELNIILKI